MEHLSLAQLSERCKVGQSLLTRVLTDAGIKPVFTGPRLKLYTEDQVKLAKEALKKHRERVSQVRSERGKRMAAHLLEYRGLTPKAAPAPAPAARQEATMEDWARMVRNTVSGEALGVHRQIGLLQAAVSGNGDAMRQLETKVDKLQTTLDQILDVLTKPGLDANQMAGLLANRDDNPH